MKYLRLTCITCSLILVGTVLSTPTDSVIIKYSMAFFFAMFAIMWYNFKELRI